MSKQKFFLYSILGVALIGIILFLGFYFLRNKTDWSLRETELVSQGKSYIFEQKYPEAIHTLEDSLQKTKNNKEEAYVKYSLAFATYNNLLTQPNNEAEVSAKKVLDLSKDILENKQAPEIVKAQTTEIIDRLFIDRERAWAQALILSDDYFKQFSQDGNAHTWRTNFLMFGEKFYPFAGVEMRLATVYADDLIKLSKEPESEAVNVEKNRVKRHFMNAVSQGNMSLKKDFTSQDQKANIPEILLTKAVAAEYYYKAVQELPFGDIEKLYTDAFDAADQYYSPVRPTIQKYYDRYKAEKK